MGILNTTPDSFYDGANYVTEIKVLKRVEQILEEGADFIDIGGYSSRPFAKNISEKVEFSRTIPFIKSIKREFPNALISIDSFRSSIVKEAIEHGASIVNDISGMLSQDMLKVVSDYKVPYILVHMRGNPQTMQQKTDYKNVTSEVIDFLINKTHKATSIGINDIIVDPGFGFSKTTEQNYELLKNLTSIKRLVKKPLLVGLSRKSMIYKLLKTTPDLALNGSLSLSLFSILQGANIIRTHDVKETKEISILAKQLQKD